MKKFCRVSGILFIIAYMVAGWYRFRFGGLMLVVGTLAAIRLYRSGIEDDPSEPEPEHDSCEGCKHNLGGGHCKINLEGECREGGGYEAWEE